MAYKIKLNSFFLYVKDLKRAICFYERILGQKVTDEEKGLFIHNDIHLYLYDYQESEKSIIFGDNCLLSFEVDIMDNFIKTLNELGSPIVFPLMQIGSNYVMEFRDSEGNDVEVYSKCSMCNGDNYSFY